MGKNLAKREESETLPLDLSILLGSAIVATATLKLWEQVLGTSIAFERVGICCKL